MPTASSDLSARLRKRSPAELAELLTRVPLLGEAIEGRGPLARVGPYAVSYPRGYGAEQRTIERLAVVLSTEIGIHACLASLDRTARDLVSLAVWHGGALSRAQALAEVAASDARSDARSGATVDAGTAERLDAAAARLDGALLTDPGAGWVVLRRGVAEVADLPGIPVRPTLERTNSDVLQRILTKLGERPPTRKAQRIDALEARLRDAAAVRAALGRLSGDAARVLNVLLGEGPQSVRDLGQPYYRPWDPTVTPLHELEELCLAGVDHGAQWCWVWLDVIVGLNGCLVTEWPREPQPEPAPLRDPGGLPAVLGRLSALIAIWRSDPAPGLATGGLGVRPVRAAAKQLGMPAGEVGLLVNVAVALGLLDRVRLGSTGRGRAAKVQWGWAPTALAQDFAALPAERRWALLVQGWRDAEELDETQGLPERLESTDLFGIPLARSALLGLLAGLPPGMGLDPDELAALAGHRSPVLLAGQATPNLVAAARSLGLVPPEGPVGLTALGRALLDGPDALAAALPPPVTSFVVQADLSVIAPPDLAPDLTARLERYAELESAAGARLYRLTEARLAAALDDGEDDDGILGFLDAHATAPLAQNVTYLVCDVARRHGRVRSGTCASYVRSDDAALLSRALGVKAAKLRALAPTVAVSALPQDKVVTALRADGLMPVTEDADGAVLRPTATAPPSSKRSGLPRLRDRLDPDAAQATRMATELLAAPPPPPPQAPSPAALLFGPGDSWPGPLDEECDCAACRSEFDDEAWDTDPALLATGREILRALMIEDPRKEGSG